MNNIILSPFITLNYEYWDFFGYLQNETESFIFIES